MLTIFITTAMLIACAQFPSRDGAPTPLADTAAHEHASSDYANPSSYVVHGERYHVLASCQGYDKRGIASWYGSKFHGRRTSSGEAYDMNAMTAANKTLPIPCNMRVTNLKTGKSVVVKVNDRGPFVKNRLIDLSHMAAAKLGIIGTGTGLVEVQSLHLKPNAPAAVATAAYSAPASATKKAKAIPAPEPAVAEAEDPAIYLQVGAFAKRANADKLKHRLHAAHINHVLLQPDLDTQRILYRVRIGPIVGVSATDDLSDRLVQAGFGVPQVVIVSQSLAKR